MESEGNNNDTNDCIEIKKENCDAQVEKNIETNIEKKSETAVKECIKVPDTGGGIENNDIGSDMDQDSESSTPGTSCTVNTPIESFEETKEVVEFKLIFNKKKHDICFPYDETIMEFKKHLESLISVPIVMQKVMFKGLCKDEKTLRETGIVKGAKVMVVGSTLTDILAVNTPTDKDVKEEKTAAASKEPLCKQKMHKKILDKGVPEDSQPGIKNTKETLPPYPLSGMLNKSGGKVRLTFKLELDQIWIGTKERTDKIPMNTIKTIVNETIEGHEEYQIMGIQLGTTEASRYWLYWVPSQYVDAIKDAILGKWQYF